MSSERKVILQYDIELDTDVYAKLYVGLDAAANTPRHSHDLRAGIGNVLRGLSCQRVIRRWYLQDFKIHYNGAITGTICIVVPPNAQQFALAMEIGAPLSRAEQELMDIVENMSKEAMNA